MSAMRVHPLLPNGSPDFSRVAVIGGVASLSIPGFYVEDQRQFDARELVRESAVANWNRAQR